MQIYKKSSNCINIGIQLELSEIMLIALRRERFFEDSSGSALLMRGHIITVRHQIFRTAKKNGDTDDPDPVSALQDRDVPRPSALLLQKQDLHNSLGGNGGRAFFTNSTPTTRDSACNRKLVKAGVHIRDGGTGSCRIGRSRTVRSR